jgi:hypothetical protein
MSLSLVDDHSDRAVANLLGQFRGKPRLEAFVRALVDQVQEVEAAFWELATERTIGAAVGAQIDGLGAVVGLARASLDASLDDEVYRALLRAWVKVRRSSGTADQLLEVVRLAEADPAFALTLTEPETATVKVVLDQATPVLEPGLLHRALLVPAKSAGVKLYLEGPPAGSAEGDWFSFADGSVETNSTHGFGDSGDPDVGGVLSGAYAG